jgi:drug/metabolite transporter (DMT)-like permease
MTQIAAMIRWLFGQAYLLLPVTMMCWAGNAVVGRALAGPFPPIALSELRWSGAFCVLLPFAWRHIKRDWPVIARHWRYLALLGLSGIGIFNTLQYTALNYTTALNVLLMQPALPLLVAGFAFLLLRERLTAGQFGGIVISLFGVVLIVTNGDLGLLASLQLNPGDLIFFFAMFVYAFYAAMLKRRPEIHWLSLLTVTIGMGCLFIFPFFLWELSTGARIVWNTGTVLGLAYVTLFPSTLAYICFNRGVDLIGPNRAGPFFHLTPLFGVLLAMTFLGEELTLAHGLGAGCIVCGIVIASRKTQGAKKRVVPADGAG